VSEIIIGLTSTEFIDRFPEIARAMEHGQQFALLDGRGRGLGRVRFPLGRVPMPEDAEIVLAAPPERGKYDDANAIVARQQGTVGLASPSRGEMLHEVDVTLGRTPPDAPDPQPVGLTSTRGESGTDDEVQRLVADYHLDKPDRGRL
jgi:hypothetical protein